jgi:hypothetical protein
VAAEWVILVFESGSCRPNPDRQVSVFTFDTLRQRTEGFAEKLKEES